MALPDDLVATAVTWGENRNKWEDWTDKDLNEAIQYVQEEGYLPSTRQSPAWKQTIWFKTVEVKNPKLRKLKKNLGGAATQCFAFVISNMELTDEQAQEVMSEYFGTE